MHEEQHHGEELDQHQDDQQRQEQGADVDVGERHLEAGDDGEGEGDDDVRRIAEAVVDLVSGGAGDVVPGLGECFQFVFAGQS